jgi:Mg-chelatase subunit ChlI
MGVKQFWIIATANPTELSEDALNVRLPEPLWDRFDAVLWVPIAPLKYQARINGRVEKAKESLPVIWGEEGLLELWEEAQGVEVSESVEYVITLINRIMGFCQHAQHYDASSLTEMQKRELCSKCNRSYICSQIARPPSVRAKLALTRLAKGFAFLRGSGRVELIDVQRAFPLVFWKRLTLMDEAQVANRLERLQDLARDLIQEIRESREAIDLVNSLKERFNQGEYGRLERWVNSKAWIREVKEDLDDYYLHVRDQLRAKLESADKVERAKICVYARMRLPPDLAREFEGLSVVEIDLTPENVARLLKIDAGVFGEAKEALSRGEKRFKLSGESALKWLTMK